MAWYDQCKMIFCTTARTRRLMSAKKRSIGAVVREMSAESGIPRPVLDRWWLEAGGADSKLMCINGCGKPVHLSKNTGEPYAEGTMYYGLCSQCRRMARYEKKVLAKIKKEGKDDAIVKSGNCESQKTG